MLGLLLFAIGVMYTPGPVNLLSLNMGLANDFHLHTPFSFGVGCAVAFWFLVFGYAGTLLIAVDFLPYIAAVGVCLILYLAVKLVRVPLAPEDTDKAVTGDGNLPSSVFSFKEGFLLQLFNPKAMLVVLPVTTIQFPAMGIQGMGILIWSVVLGGLGFGAPFSYAVMGSAFSRRVKGGYWMRYLNFGMALMLVYVAGDMAYHHVYCALTAG